VGKHGLEVFEFAFWAHKCGMCTKQCKHSPAFCCCLLWQASQCAIFNLFVSFMLLPVMDWMHNPGLFFFFFPVNLEPNLCNIFGSLFWYYFWPRCPLTQIWQDVWMNTNGSLTEQSHVQKITRTRYYYYKVLM